VSGPLVYVGRRPCGCRKGAIPSEDDIARVGGFLKDGGSIHTLTADVAARIPTSCPVCTPIRQAGLFDAPEAAHA
jgi:hypothetical protein